MVSTIPTIERARFPMMPRLVQVREIIDITPSMRRFRFGGDDLATFQSLDADDHMKLVFPNPGEELPVMPVATEDGLQMPEGLESSPRRDFTPRHFDTATNTLEVDFFLHGAGPAGSWAERAQVGSQIGILGPRGSKVPTGIFDWYLLLGDETELPSISRRIEGLPAGARVIAFVEIDGPAEEQTILSDADVQLTWLHRNGAAPGTTNLLDQAIRALPKPDGVGYTVAGGEANSLRPVRAYMKEAGYDPQFTRFSGHWKLGVADHDHHEEI